MNTQYWKERWINTLVKSGVEKSAAEAAYEATYKMEPADPTKSPEIQAFLTQNPGDQSAKRAAH